MQSVKTWSRERLLPFFCMLLLLAGGAYILERQASGNGVRLVLLTRYSLLSGLLLVGIVPLALRAAPNLLGSLFVLSRPVQLFNLAWLSVLVGTMVVVTARVVEVNAPLRYQTTCAFSPSGSLLAFLQFFVALALAVPVPLACFLQTRAAALPGGPPWAGKRWFGTGLLGLISGFLLVMTATILQFVCGSRPGQDDGLFPLQGLSHEIWSKLLGGYTTGWSDRFINDLAGTLGYHAGFTQVIDGQVVFTPGHVQLAALMASVFLGYLLAYVLFWRGSVPSSRSPFVSLSYVLLLVLMLGFLLQGAAFMLDLYRIPISLAVALFCFLQYLFSNTDHFFYLGPKNRAKTSTAAPSAPTLLQVVRNRQFPSTSGSAEGSQIRRTLVAVTASGGGIQAAAWTARVLSGLREMYADEFARSTFLISAVSGGSVGTMYYLDDGGQLTSPSPFPHAPLTPYPSPPSTGARGGDGPSPTTGGSVGGGSYPRTDVGGGGSSSSCTRVDGSASFSPWSPPPRAPGSAGSSLPASGARGSAVCSSHSPAPAQTDTGERASARQQPTPFPAQAWNGHAPQADPDSSVRKAMESSLEATAWGLAFPDFLRMLLPPIVSRTDDRGARIETAWRSRLNSPDTRMAEWMEPVFNGAMPIPVFNATIVETGQRFLAAPALGRRAAAPQSWEARQLFELYPDANPYVSTMVRLSATFPFVSPICRPWPTNDPNWQEKLAYHFADGGYIDNEGMVTVIEWLYDLLDPAYFPLEERVKKFDQILIIRIMPFPASAANEADQGKGWLYSTLGPIETLMNVRTSSQQERNDLAIQLFRQALLQVRTSSEAERQELAVQLFNRAIEHATKDASPQKREELALLLFNQVASHYQVPVDAAKFTFEAPDGSEPPLSWMLTDAQKREIDKAWDSLISDRSAQNPLRTLDRYFQRRDLVPQHR